MAIEIRTKRREEVSSAPIRKGLLQENESIELYSKFMGQYYEKNVIRLEDEDLTGEFDLDEKNRKQERINLIDIKSRYTVFSFFQHLTGEMDKDEAAQLEGYSMLGNCPRSEIANTLVNNHPEEIERILYYEALKWRDPNDPDKVVFEVPMWRKIQILKNHVFDRATLNKYIAGDYLDEQAQEEYDSFVEIPLEERVIRQVRESEPELQKRIREACKRGKKYLKEVWNIHDVK